jgi:hypothetical protein
VRTNAFPAQAGAIEAFCGADCREAQSAFGAERRRRASCRRHGTLALFRAKPKPWRRKSCFLSVFACGALKRDEKLSCRT